jgi:hypothetical protein
MTPEVPDLAEFKATFEHRDSLVEVSFAEVEEAGGKTGMGNSIGLIGGFGYPDLFLGIGDPLGECSKLGQ